MATKRVKMDVCTAPFITKVLQLYPNIHDLTIFGYKNDSSVIIKVPSSHLIKL